MFPPATRKCEVAGTVAIDPQRLVLDPGLEESITAQFVGENSDERA